jgi:hypothetical protein
MADRKNDGLGRISAVVGVAVTVKKQTVRLENRSVGKAKYCGGCCSDVTGQRHKKTDRCVRMNVVTAGAVTLIVLRA